MTFSISNSYIVSSRRTHPSNLHLPSNRQPARSSHPLCCPPQKQDATGVTAVGQPSCNSHSKKKTSARDMLADLPFPSTKPSAVVVDSVSTPPPAFEPGSRTKSAAAKKPDTKRPTDKKPVARKTATKRPGAKKTGVKKTTVKSETLAMPVRKARKAAASLTKGSTAAERSPLSSAGRSPSVLPKDETAAAAAAAASPGSCISDGSGLDHTTAGSMLASSPPAASLGGAARSRVPMTGYSSVFGMGLQHQVSGKGGGSAATAGREAGGGSSGQPRKDGKVPRASAAWVDAGGKRAMGYHREWRGAAPSSQHVSDARSDSPTTAATLDSFNLKLSLESPSRGPLNQPSNARAPAPAPPPPPTHGHPFMVHHQFPHHHHQQPPCYSHISWAGGGYPSGARSQQSYGFPVELMSPVDTRYTPLGSGSQGGFAFSKVDDTSEAVRGVSPAPSNEGEETTARDRGEDVPQGTAAAAAATAGTAAGTAAATTVSEEAAPRRTGFMSYLLHQAPTSPPLGSCPSPVAAPTAPVGTSDAEL